MKAKMQVTRLFDELNEIKHSCGSMKPKRLFYILAACGIALSAHAQTKWPTETGTNIWTNASRPANTNTPALVVPTTPVGSAAPATTPPPDTNQPAATATPLSTAPIQTRATRALTLDDCIRLALEHNLDIQIQKYNPEIDRFNVDVAYGVYEPVFSFSASKNYSDRPGAVGLLDPTTHLPVPTSSTIQEDNAYTPDLKGVLPTGLTYDLSGTLIRSVTQEGPPAHYGPPVWDASDPGPGITLRQPLLKNLWIDQSRLTIQLNKQLLKMSEQALRLQVMTSVTSVKDAYFNLLYARGNVEANATAYKLAEQLVSENLKRVQVGALAPLDEKQSESQAAASLAAMQVAQQALVVQENTLKSLLTDHYAEWADTSLLPSEELVAIPQDLNLQESWRRAVTQRPELIEAKINVEKQNITLKYDLNQVFPELDLTGTYGRNAISESLGNTFDDLRQGDHSYYSYGAFISIPLGGNISARNQRKADKSTLKQLLLSLKQTEQNIVIAVDNDVGSVRSTLQQVHATHDARVYAEDALAAERKKLENGKSTSFIVLQLISNLTTAKVAEVQALANYNIAVAQLSLDEGNTIEDSHIDLKWK